MFEKFDNKAVKNNASQNPTFSEEIVWYEGHPNKEDTYLVETQDGEVVMSYYYTNGDIFRCEMDGSEKVVRYAKRPEGSHSKNNDREYDIEKAIACFAAMLFKTSLSSLDFDEDDTRILGEIMDEYGSDVREGKVYLPD